LSASRIEAFSECPWYFYNEYLCHKTAHIEAGMILKSLSTSESGSSVHSVAEQYTKALIAIGQESDFEKFKLIFDGEWQEDHYIPETEYEEIHGMLYRWAEKYIAPLDISMRQKWKWP